MTEIKRKWNAGDINRLISEQYSGKEYTVFFEVARGTGANARSWVDAMVMSLWPTKGLYISAFEVKVSRADFLNELAVPGKNQWARDNCDEFWYVTAPGVVKGETEIPDGCGWLSVRGDGLETKLAAKRMQRGDTLSRELFASLCRSSDKSVQNRVRDYGKEFKATDPEWRRLCRIEDGYKQFLQSRHAFCPDGTAQEVTEALECATADSHVESVLGAIKSRIGYFDDSMQELFLQFAGIAHLGLTASSEMGRFVDSLSSRTNASEALKKHGKVKKEFDRRVRAAMKIEETDDTPM